MALISGQPGYVTQYGVVYDNGIKLEQAYLHSNPLCYLQVACDLYISYNNPVFRSVQIQGGAISGRR